MICHVKYLEFLFPYCAQNRPNVSGGHMTFVGLAFRAWAVFGVILLIVIGHRHIFFYLFYCSLIEEFSVSCSDRCFFMRATNVLVHRILLLSFIQVLLGVISRELAFLNIWQGISGPCIEHYWRSFPIWYNLNVNFGAQIIWALFLIQTPLLLEILFDSVKLAHLASHLH